MLGHGNTLEPVSCLWEVGRYIIMLYLGPFIGLMRDWIVGRRHGEREIDEWHNLLVGHRWLCAALCKQFFCWWEIKFQLLWWH